MSWLLSSSTSFFLVLHLDFHFLSLVQVFLMCRSYLQVALTRGGGLHVADGQAPVPSTWWHHRSKRGGLYPSSASQSHLRLCRTSLLLSPSPVTIPASALKTWPLHQYLVIVARFSHKNRMIWCQNGLSRQVGGLTKEVNYRRKLSVPEKLALKTYASFFNFY